MTTGARVRSTNRRTVVRLSLVVAGMFAFGYALVPLYNVFCDITGVNGKTVRADAAVAASAAGDTSRWIEVQFTGTVMAGLPWEFHPVTRSVRVHPGEPTTVAFLATNTAAGATVGQGVPSVTPGRAAKYFNKTECFCFERQPLDAGETKEMPLTFLVDAALPDDVHTITLSYALFNIDRAGAQAEGIATSENRDSS